MNQAQQNKYLETKIQTASSEQLLIILIDGAIKFCKMGIEAINQNNHDLANKHLIKVQDIISELTITLDHTSGISDSLLKLYEYFVYLLIEANMQKKVEPVEKVLGYLTELKETWILAALQLKKQQQLAANPQAFVDQHRVSAQQATADQQRTAAIQQSSAERQRTSTHQAAANQQTTTAQQTAANQQPAADQSTTVVQQPVSAQQNQNTPQIKETQPHVNMQQNKYAQQYKVAQQNKDNAATPGSLKGVQYG